MPGVSVDTAACSTCGAVRVGGARFCAQCGAALSESPASATGERKQVTILFSDLSGYTELSERLDPEETGALMARIFERATAIVEGYEGRVEKLMGDAVMAVFGATDAHEDDPIRAVRTALELHATVDELAVELEPRLGTHLAMHSGVHTGLIVTGELNLAGGSVGVVGDAINVASRLMAKAPAGQIWIGPTTARLATKAIDTETVGDVAFKGKSAPLPVSRVVGLVATERIMRPTRTRFVGREAELETLLSAVDQARAGRSTSIGVLAEAGGGKTRLFEELRRNLPVDTRWLEGRAYAYAQRIPYFLLVDLWRRAFRIKEDDQAEIVRTKLVDGVGPLLGPDSDALRILAHLFGVSADDAEAVDSTSIRPRLVNACRSLTAAWAAEGPSVVCVQDLHWADSASAAVVREIMAEPGAPVVYLANYRPGFAFDDGRIQQLDLSSLSSTQVHTLVGSMLEDDAPDGLEEFIAARSEGNPFFAEEVVTTLLETGTLAKNGSWTLTAPLESTGVPSTVQGVLAARIDRLDEDHRRVLREAAVIGREFLYDLVSRISMVDTPLDAALDDLEHADLIREKQWDRELEYIFKHALTQEVAYEGLLKSERKALHRRVGEAMETVLSGRLEEYVETLAYHFLRAGEIDKAARYAIDAGKRAFERHVISDADAHFRAGYALLVDVDRTPAQDRLLVELLVEWADVLNYDLKQREAGGFLDRHWALAQQVDDPRLTAVYRAMMACRYWADLEFDRADEIADDALAQARLHDVPRAEQKVLTYSAIGRITRRCHVAEGFEMFARAIALGESQGCPTYQERLLVGLLEAWAGRFEALDEDLRWMDAQVACGAGRYRPYAACIRAMRDLCLMDPDSALAHATLGLSVPHDAIDGSYLYSMRTIPLIILRRYDEAASSATEHLEFHEARPTEYCEAMGRAQLGGARSALGKLDGIEEMFRDLAARQRAGDRLVECWDHLSLAETYVRIHDREVVPPVGVLLRNPGFVLRHALPARRNARRHLEQARRLSVALGLSGASAWEAFTASRVALAETRRDEALRELDVCLDARRAAGFPEPSPHIAAFMERLQA